MKQLTTIGVVAMVLFAAALYFANREKTEPPSTPAPTVVLPTTQPEQPTGPTPVVTADAHGTLSLRTSISHGYLAQGSASDVYAAIDIEAIRQEGGERPPLNVALVLDRSGSMSAGKMEHAKEAARRLVNVLGERDRISIVSYSSDVTVDFYSQPVTAATRPSLIRAIDRISIGGGTNLSGGFQRGFSEVSKWKAEESVNRVILMSDGHANIGVTNSGRLAELSSNALRSGVSVSTIGVGLDYNEDLMTKMANLGAGNYYFVDQTPAISGILDQELKGLASTVARNTAVVIELGPGVSVKELHGFNYRVSGNQVYVSLAEFASEEKKNILMKLAVDGSAAGQRPVISTSLSYDDVVTDRAGHHTLALSAVVTPETERLAELVNVDVVARVQQVEVANTMQQAMDLWSAGEGARATEMIETTQKSMRERRSKHEFKGAAKYDEADRELDEIKAKIQTLAPASESGRRLRKEKKARSNSIYLLSDSF